MNELVGRWVDTGRPVRIRLSGGRIYSAEEFEGPADQWLAPGLLDIQVNGFAGYDVNADDVTPADVRALAEAEFRAGVTAFCPTVITGPESRIITALRAVAEARAADPLLARAIPCIHVEGPFIASADGPRGAHDAAFLRPPDPEEFERWQEASGGLVGIVTLAPELPGAPDFIKHITATGAIAAIGHTAATADDIAAAISAGARLSTHLGNGAHAMLPRHPNYLWEQLAADELIAGFIADGHHLAPPVLATMLRAKGVERSILVSDTVALAGMPPGHYTTPVGGEVELTGDGRLVLPGSTLLAGATYPLSHCVDVAARHGRVSLAEAVRMASANPARLLGLPPRDSLRPGDVADLIAFTRDEDGIRIRTTVAAGRSISA